MLDPTTLVGLLADPARRRVVAALVLEADTREGLGLDEVAQMFDVGRRYT